MNKNFKLQWKKSLLISAFIAAIGIFFIQNVHANTLCQLSSSCFLGPDQQGISNDVVFPLQDHLRYKCTVTANGKPGDGVLRFIGFTNATLNFKSPTLLEEVVLPAQTGTYIFEGTFQFPAMMPHTGELIFTWVGFRHGQTGIVRCEAA